MAEDVPLPVQTGDLIGCCTDGTYMYILADEKAEEGVRSVLTRVRLADGTAEIMEDYQSSNTPEDAIVNRLGPALAPDGTLWAGLRDDGFQGEKMDAVPVQHRHTAAPGEIDISFTVHGKSADVRQYAGKSLLRAQRPHRGPSMSPPKAGEKTGTLCFRE